MITIAEPYARFDKTISTVRLETAATRLMEFVEAELVAYYRREGRDLAVKIFVRVERGSTKTWITVAAFVNVLVFYGSIRQSIDYLIHDAKYVYGLILPSVPVQLGLGSVLPAVSQSRLGMPGKLSRLFHAVERGQMSADEATRAAVDLIYRVEGPSVVDSAPGLTERLSNELKDASRFGPSFYLQQRLPTPSPLPYAIAHDVLAVRKKTGVIARRNDLGQLTFSSY